MTNISISEIVTASPPGLNKSNLLYIGYNRWAVDVTWRPSSSQIQPSIFCYSALDRYIDA